MKAVEFKGKLSDEDNMVVPGEIARQIPAGSNLRVILLWDDDGDDWLRIGKERFADAYAPEDVVYEKLIDEPASR
jgi:hypothetical protein